MKITRGHLLALALAVPLILCAGRPANAQATGSDVVSFQTSLQNLAQWLNQQTANTPQQTLVNQLQQRIDGLTSDQITAVANTFNIPAFNNVVTTLTTNTPALLPLPTTDPPANLSPPDYGVCVPTMSFSVSGVGSPGNPGGFPLAINGPVPSNAVSIAILDAAIIIAKDAAIVADKFCDHIDVIAGGGTSLPQCLVAMVVDLIAANLEAEKESLTFCDSNVTAAQVQAGWTNTQIIDEDLFRHDNNVAAHLNQIDSHLTLIDSEVNSNSNAVNVNLGATVASVGLNLANGVASMDTDINNHITGIDTDLNTHLTQVDSDVTTRATQIDNEISNFQALDLRLKIEQALAANITIALFELPTSQGGQLDLVRSIVVDTINKVLASGGTVGTASKSLTTGDTAKAAGQFKSAYSSYMSAYQAAAH